MKAEYKAGEYIIDFTNIYQIASISLGEVQGIEEVLVHYKPVQGTDKVFTASIPERSLKKSGLRKVLTPSEAKEVLEDLKKPLDDFQFNAQLVKDEIYLNVACRIVKPLKYLWKNPVGIPKATLDLKNDMIDHLSMEIAFVTKQSPSLIKEKIEQNLNA